MQFVEKYYKTIKIFFLVLIFGFVLLYNFILLGEYPFDPFIFAYSIIVFLFVCLNYYVLTSIIYASLKISNKLPLLLIAVVLLYFVSLFGTTYPLQFLVLQYPENPMINRWSRLLNPLSSNEYNFLLGFGWMTGQIYFHLILMMVGGTADRYLVSLKRITQLQLLNNNLELDLLKSQVQPHFLFNTLNNIYSLVMDNEKAGSTVLKLSDLLRFSLYESNGKRISLKKEIEFLEDYIELEKIRHHRHVNIQYDFSSVDDERCQIAPLLFINFVENAFKHGVHNTIEPTFVNIKLMHSQQLITFEISNHIPQSTTKEIQKAGGKGLGNIKRRLEILYPDQHEISISNNENLFNVNLKIQTA